MIIIEASPVAYAYENPLADTGITRVIKNILMHLDSIISSQTIPVYLYAQENQWNQFLLNKFIFDTDLKNIHPLLSNKLFHFSSQNYYRRTIKKLSDVKAQLISLEPDNKIVTDLLTDTSSIFHAHFLGVPDFIRNIRNNTVLYTIHDIFPLSHKGLFTKDVVRFYQIYLSTFRAKDYAVCVSEYTASQFRQKIPYIPSDHVLTVPNAGDHVYTENIDENTLANWNLTSENYFLCVSTLEPRKNFPSVVRGFLQYLNNSPHKQKLVIVGSKGWMEEHETQFLQEQEQQGNIILTGRVSDAELRCLLTHARLFISGSFCEGFGLGAVEAMTLGTPAMVPANTAQKEVVSEFGITLEDWSPNNIAKMLRSFDDSSFLFEMKEKASNIVLRYSWKKTAKMYLQRYGEILSR